MKKQINCLQVGDAILYYENQLINPRKGYKNGPYFGTILEIKQIGVRIQLRLSPGGWMHPREASEGVELREPDITTLPLESRKAPKTFNFNGKAIGID